MEDEDDDEEDDEFVLSLFDWPLVRGVDGFDFIADLVFEEVDIFEEEDDVRLAD
jgi:hypothetical protein